jgi:uncharacterized protein (TIGR03663 family)
VKRFGDEAGRSSDWPFWISVALASLVGLLLRFVLPELRPIHHDEAVNWYFADTVLRTGLYEYDGGNYHGPLFHYASALGRLVGGDRLFALRWPTMLVGALMVPLAAGLRGWFGRAGAAGAAWAIALSPSLVFYARDAIHETWLAALTLLALVAAAGVVRADDDRGRGRMALLLGAALGGMVATKETGVITVAGWGAGLVVAWIAGDPRARRWLRRGGEALASRRVVGLAAAACAVVVVVLFTGLFRDVGGLVELARTLAVWGARGVEGGGHDKPFFVFADWLARSEGGLMVVAAFAVVYSATRDDPTDLALAAWTGTALLAYSAISYKTPWCLLQVALPLSLLAGRGLGEMGRLLFEARRPFPLILAVSLACTTGLSFGRSVEYSFVRYDHVGFPLVYVQTHREFHHAMTLVTRIRDAVGDEAVVRHLYDVDYPFNWYLRPQGPAREELEDVGGALSGDVLMTVPARSLEVADLIEAPYLYRRFRFRDGRRLDLWVAERHEALLDDRSAWSRIESTWVEVQRDGGAIPLEPEGGEEPELPDSPESPPPEAESYPEPAGGGAGTSGRSPEEEER